MGNKKTAVVQSSYIPWKGYFDLIHQVEEFIVYDDVQYTRCDWRSRNRIKTANGSTWLTIPIKRYFKQCINEASVANPHWANKHWRSIKHSYSKAEFFPLYEKKFEELYRQASNLVLLSDINILFIKEICCLLGITTNITRSEDYRLEDLDKNRRLLSLCQLSGTTHYLSGPAAMDYLDIDLFTRAEIDIEFINYSIYPIYPQLYGEFVHEVSVLDLLFHCGESALSYITSKEHEAINCHHTV